MAYYLVVLINLLNNNYLVSIERYVLVALKMTHVCFCVGAETRGPCQKSSSIILHFIFWGRVLLNQTLNWLNRSSWDTPVPSSQCWNYKCSFPCLALYMNTHRTSSPALNFSLSPIYIQVVMKLSKLYYMQWGGRKINHT